MGNKTMKTPIDKPNDEKSLCGEIHPEPTYTYPYKRDIHLITNKKVVQDGEEITVTWIISDKYFARERSWMAIYPEHGDLKFPINPFFTNDTLHGTLTFKVHACGIYGLYNVHYFGYGDQKKYKSTAKTTFEVIPNPTNKADIVSISVEKQHYHVGDTVVVTWDAFRTENVAAMSYILLVAASIKSDVINVEPVRNRLTGSASIQLMTGLSGPFQARFYERPNKCLGAADFMVTRDKVVQLFVSPTQVFKGSKIQVSWDATEYLGPRWATPSEVELSSVYWVGVYKKYHLCKNRDECQVMSEVTELVQEVELDLARIEEPGEYEVRFMNLDRSILGASFTIMRPVIDVFGNWSFSDLEIIFL
jgi:hypothetical protein